MIDWRRVTELREEIGAEDFDEIVVIFLEEVDDAIAALGDGSEPLEAQLHFLKGSALNLGFADFSGLCQRGETLAAAGNTNIDTEEIQSSYARSRDDFLAGLQSRFAA